MFIALYLHLGLTFLIIFGGERVINLSIISISSQSCVTAMNPSFKIEFKLLSPYCYLIEDDLKTTDSLIIYFHGKYSLNILHYVT
jgi:predicted ABC-type sugar transport system permease subunit